MSGKLRQSNGRISYIPHLFVLVRKGHGFELFIKPISIKTPGENSMLSCCNCSELRLVLERIYSLSNGNMIATWPTAALSLFEDLDLGQQRALQRVAHSNADFSVIE